MSIPLRVETAGNDVIRNNHYVKDPVTGLYVRTTLIEGQRTNLIGSDNFDTGWTSQGTPVITSGISDPEGGTSAYRIADDDTAASEYKYIIPTYTGDGVKGHAFVVREATMPASGNQQLVVWDSTAAVSRLTLDITGWTSGKPTVSAAVGTLLGVVEKGNGFWAIYAETTSVTAANTHSIRLIPATTAAETGSIDVWRVNAFDDPIPSHSILDASASRAADSAYIDFTAPPQEMTVYTRFYDLGTARIASGTIWYIGDAANNVANMICRRDSGTPYYEIAHNTSGGGVQSTLGTGTPSYGDRVEIRTTLAVDGSVQIHQSINGGAEVSATPSAALAMTGLWSGQRLYLGSLGNGANPGVVAYHRVLAAPGSRSMDEMRALAGV